MFIVFFFFKNRSSEIRAYSSYVYDVFRHTYYIGRSVDPTESVTRSIRLGGVRQL